MGNDHDNAHRSSLAQAAEGFDWRGVDGDPVEGQDLAEGRAALGLALRRLLLWMVEDRRRTGYPGNHPHDAIVGRRVLALAWALDPSLVPGSPSLLQLAKRIGVHHSTLQNWTDDAMRVFGVTNRAQSSRRRRQAAEARRGGSA